MAEQGKAVNSIIKKKIIADYLETQNYSETAKKFNVAVQSVKNYVEKDKDFVNLLKEKKEKENQSVLEEMKRLSSKKINILNLAMDEMERLLKEKKVSPNSLATIYGVLLDKELKVAEINLRKKEGNNEEINRNLENIAELLNQPKKVRTEEDLEK